ncbi:hypothetical protein [Candidatus Palauibacter sp.]|uniref:hypothetical protein n=1 Tax=Candidatus Palauibacter sp. TaxID=3101350 RepID=UPI003CC6C3F8
MLNKSEEWDHDAWGTPVSATHLGFAISVFSQRLVEYSLLLGAQFDEEEQRSVLQVWRYAGYVMGIPKPSSIPPPRMQRGSTRPAICANRRRTSIRSPWRTC